jgi:hypothetical protein
MMQELFRHKQQPAQQSAETVPAAQTAATPPGEQTTEPVTTRVTQRRTRKPELPWKCVTLKDHRIAPLDTVPEDCAGLDMLRKNELSAVLSGCRLQIIYENECQSESKYHAGATHVLRYKSRNDLTEPCLLKLLDNETMQIEIQKIGGLSRLLKEPEKQKRQLEEKIGLYTIMNLLTTYNFCVHVEQIPSCTFSADNKNAPSVSCPVVSIDFCVYEKSVIDDLFSKGFTKNPKSGTKIFPSIQHWVRFSCGGSLPSKLDPRKTFDKNHPIIGLFSSRSRENCHIIAIEKQDRHGCGRLDTYSFGWQIAGHGELEPVIARRRFFNLNYAMLDHYLLLSDYDVNESAMQVKTLNTTAEIAANLDAQIKKENRELIKARTPQSISAPKRLFFLLTAALFDTHASRSDTFSWCWSLLLRSQVVREPTLNFGLESWQRGNLGRFFLPPPESGKKPHLSLTNEKNEDTESEVSTLSFGSEPYTDTNSRFYQGEEKSAGCFRWGAF